MTPSICRAFLALCLLGAPVVMATTAADTEAQERGGINIILESTKVTASDGDLGDLFGAAVALTNNRAVVGATGEDALGFDAGSAYIYERQTEGEIWMQVAKISASDGATDDSFGGSVDVEDDTIVVGAPFNDVSATDGGGAYVFYRDELGAWNEIVKLTASDPDASEFFGISVAISSDTIVVGALDNELGDKAGAAYVFERDAGGIDNWGEVNKLLASDGETDNRFGSGVDISGDTIVVGAPEGQLPPQPITGSGAVYVYQRNDTDPFDWTEDKILTASDGDFGDLFGWSVSISTDFLIVGAALDDELGLDAGSAYIFERDGGGTDNWGEVKKILAVDGGQNDGFGISVSVDEEQAVVGAFNDDDDGNNAGAAHIYVRDFNGDGIGLWLQVAKLLASDGDEMHNLGSSVAWGGSQIMVGAPGTNISYVYDLSRFFEPFSNCITFPQACDRFDLVTTFTVVSGEWQNWDCEGSDISIFGTSLDGGDTAQVLCSDPGCPLGRVWGHILSFLPQTYDLWYIDGDDPPVQSKNNAPFNLLNGACPDVAPPPLEGSLPSYMLEIDR